VTVSGVLIAAAGARDQVAGDPRQCAAAGDELIVPCAPRAATVSSTAVASGTTATPNRLE
jgi:hypothetical protein